MSKLRITAVAVAVAAMAGGIMAPSPAHAAECNPSEAVHEVPTPGGTFYVDHRGGDEVWLYQESNGMPGLQRGGYQALVGTQLDWQDPCNDGVTPDTMLY